MAMTVFMILPFVGEPTVEYYYTRTRYHWDYEEYSQYTSTINTCALIGKTFQYQIRIPNLFVQMISFGNTCSIVEMVENQ